jgi:DNA ligase-1
MNFRILCEYLNKLETTSGRIAKTDILADLISTTNKDEIYETCHLILGKLGPEFNNPTFNIADKTLRSFFEEYFEENISNLYKELGDLGEVIFKIHQNTKNTDNTIKEIYNSLYALTDIEGTGSQEVKKEAFLNILNKVNSLEAKYITRIVLNKTRLGFTQLTIIEALNTVLNNGKNNKKDKKFLEDKYIKHPDIGYIVEKALIEGKEALKEIDIEIFTPIFPQKCQRIDNIDNVIDKMGTVFSEFKFDGSRVQMHMSKEIVQGDLYTVKTYSRNLEESTHQFPEIKEAANKYIKANDIILDGEGLGIDTKTGNFLPFQEIMKRRRKYNIEKHKNEIPIKYYVFDILYLNGKTLINTPLQDRRKLLKEIIKENDTIIVDSYTTIKNTEELYEEFERAKEQNLEGLVVKQIDSVYQAGARSYSWVKLKVADEKLLDDTVDLPILGYYYGKGERAKFGVGGILIGIYNKEQDKFLTFTKVGTGFTDADFKELKSIMDNNIIQKPLDNLAFNNSIKPDVWIDPKVIIEVAADEITISKTHTAGFAMRFPRYIQIRTDKNLMDSTTLEEIKFLHKKQKQGYY